MARLHIGSDHAAIDLRHELAAAAIADGHTVLSETGPNESGDSVDYPDVAATVCERVHADPGTLGLLLCGTGQGVAIAANKHVGIRAAVVLDGFSARMSREHNDANVLALGERMTGAEVARDCLATFLSTDFAGGRHAPRVAKLG